MSRRPGRNRRVSNVPASSGSWTPASIPGLVLWLDNALITESIGKVTAWPDLSGVGNHFAQASSVIQPNYVANETDFPTGQAAVKLDVSSNRLEGPAIAGIAWIAAIAIYPATGFTTRATLISDTAGVAPFQGESSGVSPNWRTAAAPAGTWYRDGAVTTVALTVANAPHLYEYVPTTPWTPTGGLWIGTEPGIPSSRIWSDSCCLVLAATTALSAPDRAELVAYCQARGMIP